MVNYHFLFIKVKEILYGSGIPLCKTTIGKPRFYNKVNNDLGIDILTENSCGIGRLTKKTILWADSPSS